MIQINVEGKIYYRRETHLEVVLKECKSLLKNKINKNWKNTTQTQLAETIIHVKRSKAQEDTLLINFEVPIYKGIISIYAKTVELPYFISKTDEGPSILLEELFRFKKLLEAKNE